MPLHRTVCSDLLTLPSPSFAGSVGSSTYHAKTSRASTGPGRAMHGCVRRGRRARRSCYTAENRSAATCQKRRLACLPRRTRSGPPASCMPVMAALIAAASVSAFCSVSQSAAGAASTRGGRMRCCCSGRGIVRTPNCAFHSASCAVSVKTMGSWTAACTGRPARHSQATAPSGPRGPGALRRLAAR